MGRNLKKLAVTFLTTAAFVAAAGVCLAEEADVNQNQHQVYDGSSWVTPHFGFTDHGGGQSQNAWGYSSDGSGVSADQFEEQNHSYGGVNGDADNWTGQGGGSDQFAQMSGSTWGNGGFGAYNGQDYNAMIGSGNAGPEFAVSGMTDNFDQYIGGSAGGSAGVFGSVGVSASNSYAQLASNGSDFVSHSGDSSTSSVLSGGAVNGSYDGFVVGTQGGGTVTEQDGNGTYQVGQQDASANLVADTYHYGNAGVGYSAEMGQSHSYEQYNQGPNGWQYQSGIVDTHVAVDGYQNP